MCPHNSQTNHHVWHWSVATTARHQREPTVLPHAQLLNAFKASRRSSTVQVTQEKAQIQKDHTDAGWRGQFRLRQRRPQILCHFLVIIITVWLHSEANPMLLISRQNSSFFQTTTIQSIVNKSFALLVIRIILCGLWLNVFGTFSRKKFVKLHWHRIMLPFHE